MTPSAQPPPHVLEAFGLAGDIQQLPGSEETSLLIDGVVLKQVQDVAVSSWSQRLLASIQPEGLLIPRPLQSEGGTWAIDGWIATQFVEHLSPLQSQPELVIMVGNQFADAVAAAKTSDVRPVRSRTDRWARADRYVWTEEDLVLNSQANQLVTIFRSKMTSNTDPPFVVHGDLTGNVFADKSGTPVVLDFSPFIRPKRFGSAIVVADNLLWHEADLEIVNLINDDQDGLARALLFRMMTDLLAEENQPSVDLTDYRRVIDALHW